ncbi:uncharacterized protein LOC126808902 isoform X1 [Patella vulgata]|uniref:uncharacterized protein LOC126808902 isoform X1 n=1 Tax=Patella vulgata TaxID=6465 RepID=UPI00217F2FA7|nr:uncharacterized protein LOC126808902 isoform X1 [Patella vulgata]
MYYLSVIVLAVFAVVSARQFCPKNNQNDALAFRGRPAGAMYIRISKYIALRCCMTGYTTIRWKKWNQLQSRYDDYPWDQDREDLGIIEDGQVLEITLVRAYDEGRYICEGQNGSSTIQQEIHLKVISCEASDGKIHIVEEPVGPVTASLGDRIEWKCKGFFGCASDGSQNERIAQWQYKDSDVFHTIRNLSASYKLYKDPSSDGGTVSSILVINGVAEKDYHRTFNCLLETPARSKNFSIHISPPVTIPDRRLYFLYLFLLFPLILIVGILMNCLFGARIKYWYKTKCPCSAYSLDKDGFENDILIVRSDKDRAFVEDHVKKHIKGYKVFDKDSVQLGQIENSKMTEAIPKSYSIVIIYSKDLLMDRDADYIFQIIRGVGHRNVIVIKLENISKEELKSIISDEILKISHSVWPSITWPTTGTENSRKYKNFIYDLKDKLLTKSIPIPTMPEEASDVSSPRRTSSELPLLSQNSSGGDSGYATSPDIIKEEPRLI